ncbi:MAG: hypothetical protein ACHQKY_18625, partial [Terriglobia bacterium]
MKAFTSKKLKPPTESSQLTPAPNLRIWIVVAALLLIFAAQNFVEMRKESCTSDELIKLTAGYTYWLKHDFRLNSLHPPLLKMVSALPL